MPALNKVVTKVYLSPLLLFAIVIFFVGLGDAVMSYAAPMYIESHLNNAFLMGLVLSFSSLIGIIFDVLISERQWSRNYKFFIKSTLTISIMFPLSFLLLPAGTTTFLLGMFFWGAYYEYRGFSYYNFIHHFLARDQHTSGWAVIVGFSSFAYLLGTAIAANILDLGYKTTFAFSLVVFLVAIIAYKIFLKLYGTHSGHAPGQPKTKRKGFQAEFIILKTIWRKVWPLFLFSFTVVLVDSCFWTVGILLAEEIKLTNRLGSLFLTFYTLPPIFAGLLAAKLQGNTGKKRTAFINGFIASIFLIGVGLLKNVPLVLAFVFLLSMFATVAATLHSAVIEDFVSRLHNYSSDMVTLELVSGSIAYVVGPIVMGFIAEVTGYRQAFVACGALLMVVSLFCMFVVPRKVKMPQAELRELTLS